MRGQRQDEFCDLKNIGNIAERTRAPRKKSTEVTTIYLFHVIHVNLNVLKSNVDF